MKKPRQIIIVGPSGSGKTSVAEEVANNLGIPLVHMDDFKHRICRSPIYVMHGCKRVKTWEHPDMWDANAVACKIKACMKEGRGFVAEGSLLLHYPAIAELHGIERYYLDVPFAVSLARRKTTHKFLPSDESFALIGESETKKWVVPQMDNENLTVIDGQAPVRQIAWMISTVSGSLSSAKKTLTKSHVAAR